MCTLSPVCNAQICWVINAVSSESGWSKLISARWLSGKMGEVFIVGIVSDDGDVLWANSFEEGAGDGGLAGATAAGDAQRYRCCLLHIPPQCVS